MERKKLLLYVDVASVFKLNYKTYLLKRYDDNMLSTKSMWYINNIFRKKTNDYEFDKKAEGYINEICYSNQIIKPKIVIS